MERHIGEILESFPRNQGKRTDMNFVGNTTRLYSNIVAELGVDRKTADEWQKIAKLPVSDFQAHVEDARRNGVVPSRQKLLAKVKALFPKAKRQRKPKPLEQYKAAVDEGASPKEAVKKVLEENSEAA